MSSRTALITGVTGFLGSHLAHTLLREGYRVLALVRARNDASPRQRALDALATVGPLGADESARLAVMDADLTEGVPVLLKRIGSLGAHVDDVWHCAVVFKFQEKDRVEIVAQNVEGTRHMLELALAAGRERRPRFFYVSTAYVCGERSGLVLEAPHEGQRFHNLYEWSKNEGERLVLDCQEAERLDATVLRPSVLVGHSCTGMATSDVGYYSTLKTLYRFRNSLGANLGGQQTAWDLNLRIEGSPSREMNLVPIDFVVEAMQRLARAPFLGSHVFHIVNEAAPTLAELLESVERVLRVRGIRYVDARDFEETPMTAFEKAFHQRIAFQAPYLRADLRFSTEAFRRVVPTVVLPPPRVDAAFLLKLNRRFVEFLDRQLDTPPLSPSHSKGESHVQDQAGTGG